MKHFVLALTFGALAAPASATLLINGNSEGSTSQTATPPGWTNIGHTEGVIGYAVYNTPAYDGDYYYDIGGYGSPTPALGAGITQSAATVAGQNYTLTFGYSGENTEDVSTALDVTNGGVLTQYTIVGEGSGVFKKPFTTAVINYVATGASTAIAFTISGSTQIGFNDPLIDGVSFAPSDARIPEPATWAMMIAGFGLVGFAARRRREGAHA